MPARFGRNVLRGYRLALGACLLISLALAGGSYRFDQPQQAFVRLAALLVIAASLWPLDFRPLKRMRRLALWFAAAAALPLLQLVSLPPSVWASLPGHRVYARIAEASGTVGWRPLSLTPDLTVNALASLLVPAAAGLVAIHLDRRGRASLAHGLVALATVSALLGVLQLAAGGDALRFYDPTSRDAPVGLFANRNHQAVLMACAMPLATALAAVRVGEGKQRTAVAAVLAGLLLLFLGVLIATGSRMGLLLGFIGLAGSGWCWRAGNRTLVPRRARSRLAFLAASVAGLTLVVIGAVRSGAVGRLHITNFADETRFTALAPMSEAAGSFMPFGAGFGSFEAVFRQFEPDEMLSTIYLNAAHNEPMQLAIEGGLPALALLLVFGWWWARSTVRVLRPDPLSRRNALGEAMAFVSVILLTSSLADYPLRTPLLSGLFAIACVELAILASMRAKDRATVDACPAGNAGVQA